MAKTDSIQKRPNPLLYFFASNFLASLSTINYNLRCTGEVPEGPAIVLSNHTSNDDYKFIVSACMPHRISFLCTYHFFTFKKLNYWLNKLGVIPKHQFAQDITSLKKIRYVLQNNGLVYIAPEGTIYANGKLGYMSPSIAKMIRSFKVPVYSCKIEGAGLGNSKWSKHHHKGLVVVNTKKIIKQEETQELTIAEMMERITSSLTYNDFDFQKKNNVIVEGTDKAEGFDTMFYKCPSCGKEFTLIGSGNTVECQNCHAKATIGQNFRFKWEGDKQYFDNYIEWYDWQYECIKKEMENPSFELREEVYYGEDEPGQDNYVKVGKGIMTFCRDGWTYSGTYKNQYITEHDDCRDVFLATLKVGKHFELPFKNGHCRVFYPVKDGRTSMKWHLASRAMAERLGQ